MNYHESIANLRVDLKRKINNLSIRVKILFKTMKISAKKIELKNIGNKMKDNKFWCNQKKSSIVEKKRIVLKKELEKFKEINHGILDCYELLMIVDEKKEEMREIELDVQKYTSLISDIELKSFLSKSTDYNNSILNINAGSGGIDSQDFVQMLLRMYKKYSDRKGYNVELMDINYGEEAGIKNVTILISGEYAYGYLKSEIGVHRLVRISPFDSASRRHTSFASVWVLPEIVDDIDIKIRADDIRLDTFKAGGAGGQHVNKTDSAVRITYIPTNTVVTCQAQRSQTKNKSTAMKLLKSKLYNLEMKKKLIEKDKAEAAKMEASFGSQIRNYVLSPYQIAKDLRSGYEVGNVDAVLNGDIQGFIDAYLFYKNKQ